MFDKFCVKKMIDYNLNEIRKIRINKEKMYFMIDVHG